jgi:3-carboxy-cis,cis-muconate cycloisomerase
MASHCDPDFLQALLDVEVALAAAEADTGLIPAACLPHIQAAARADAYDCAVLASDAARDGNVVIPLVRQLTAAVAARDADAAAACASWGALARTSLIPRSCFVCVRPMRRCANP